MAWAAKPVERQPVARNPDGTLKKGAVLNPGALTNSQARIKQMLEGATVPMISRLLELAQSDNEQVALGAVREWMSRCAAPAPKAPSVNVAVQNNIGGGASSGSDIGAFLQAKALRDAGKLNDEEWNEVMNRRSWISRPAALPAPVPAPVIDVQPEPIDVEIVDDEEE